MWSVTQAAHIRAFNSDLALVLEEHSVEVSLRWIEFSGAAEEKKKNV